MTEVRVCEGRGRCLFSVAGARAGDILLRETPLVSSRQGTSAESWARLVELDEAEPLVFSPKWHIAAEAIVTAGEAVAAGVADKFVPEPASDEDGRKSAERTAQVLAALGLTDKVTPESYDKALSVMRFNGFPMREEGGLGLYDRISMMAHSCCPTASIDFEDGSTDVLLVRAIHDLEAGQEISISYINESELGQSVDMRHFSLDRWLFTCRCCRCEWPLDLSRGFCCMDPDCQGICFVRSIPDNVTMKPWTEGIPTLAPCKACGTDLSEDMLDQALELEINYAMSVGVIDGLELFEIEEMSERASSVLRQHWILDALSRALLKHYEETDLDTDEDLIKAGACSQVQSDFTSGIFEPWGGRT